MMEHYIWGTTPDGVEEQCKVWPMGCGKDCTDYVPDVTPPAPVEEEEEEPEPIVEEETEEEQPPVIPDIDPEDLNPITVEMYRELMPCEQTSDCAAIVEMFDLNEEDVICAEVYDYS